MPKLKDIQHAALLKLDEIVEAIQNPWENPKHHAAAGSPKDQILNLAKSIDADFNHYCPHIVQTFSTYL